MCSTDLLPELQTIAQLFDESGATYTIPIYQRNFSWQAVQIEQLVSDIQDAIDDGKKSYFLGNLVVTLRKENPKDFEVIDGQQRLTTLHLLLTFLAGADTSGPAAHQDRLRYESRPRSTEALRRIATEASRDVGASVHADNDEDTGIHTGYNVIRQYMKQHISDDSERNTFADFLRSKVTVVRASLPPEMDLNRYFEIMNTRGQQLQHVDIVKARLMSHLGDNAERACFAWIWDACADMESYVQMSLTRGQTDLRKKLFGTTWTWLTATKFEDILQVNRYPRPDASSSETGQLDPLTIDEAIEKYAVSGVPSADDDPENVRFRSTIEFPAFLLHVLKIVKREDDDQDGHLDDKHLVKRFDEFLGKEDPTQRIREFGFKLLQCRNLFDSFILKRQYTTTHSDDGDWSLQRFIMRGSKVKRSSKDRLTPGYVSTFLQDSQEVEEADAVDRTTKDLLLIQSMLRVTFTSARTMHWITILLRAVMDKKPEEIREGDLVDLLSDYARRKVRKAFFVGEQPVGFGINRIVFTYLDYLLLTDETKPEFRFSFRNSIEHFYPQHPDKKESGPTVSEDCLNLLGNLALVSVGANSKFSNGLPAAKAANFKTTIEKQSPKLHKMAEIARKPQGWGDDQIRDHHNAMIERLGRDVIPFEPC